MMKKLLLALFIGSAAASGLAQDDNSSKLSATTQMFLDEIAGNITVERETKNEKQLGLKPIDASWQRRHGKNDGRFYAAPDTVDGKAYIAAYLRLADVSAVSEVEALGVVLQEEFNNGLWTSLIPVDKINEVAAVSNVKRINVSSLKRHFTYKARQATNVDDALTLSTDAIAEGLQNKYDGTGVVLGIIDTGIDFNHIAFKDASGNSRIKQAYVYNGSSAKTYTGSDITSSLTDDKTEDHGTHTSSTAGGSSVKVSGSTVTVTDDHANATYGGMAPGADLYLAGINGLASTYLDNAVKAMCTYADNQGKPLVVSNSWGSQLGPHDGTGDEADVYNSLFGDSHPNRVALFAASNDGGKSKDDEGGGYHVSATASSSSPLSTILRSATYTNTDAGYFYQGIIANAWARSTSVSKLGIKIIVLDSSTGAVKTSVTKTSAGSVSGLSSYYSGTLYVYYDQVTSDKTQVILYSSNGLESQGVTQTTKDGENYYKSKYTLAIQVYPTSGSSVVDVWGGTYGYFTNHLTTSGYSWIAGSDDMCVSDEAMISNVISIGAYVTANTWNDYSGTSHSMADEYTIGDIASFSSYATAAESPTGLQYPWITAPGARLIAGINHNHTKSVDSDYSYWGDNFISDLVVNSSTNPYAAMEGTSMATPTAAGIVALWMQASLDENAQHKNLTVNDVKEIMKETAIKDSYTTTGANASHFGNGKIDALAGIKYILGAGSEPTIKADKDEVTFEGYATKTYTETITVTGTNLEGSITVTKSGASVFSIDKTNITQTDGTASATLTITYAPTSAGTHTGTITLTSTNAETVTISLTGTAEAATPTIVADKESIEFAALLNRDATQTVNVSSRFLTGNITATLTDEGGVFSLDKTSLEATEEGVELTVTFNASEEGTYTGTILLASAGAASVSIALSATASDGGTASDAFLNIAKYETIDEAGWNTTYVNTLYKYTEYEDDEAAWLTMPLYGAYSAVNFEPSAQKWIEQNVSSYSGVDWASADVFPGSSTYFTGTSGNGRARALGNNSSSNEDAYTMTFYVTNTTGVKLLGLGRSGIGSYPAHLYVYECSINADGSLNPSSTAAKSATSTSTSTTTPFNIAVTDLDASKVYKVVAGQYRGYLYEIAFQTPIVVEKIPTVNAEPKELTFEPIYATTEATQTFTASGKYLEGDINITVTDENGVFTVDKDRVSASDASQGTEVTVTFAPETAGNYSATITLASTGAEPLTITLTGTAEPATPTILCEQSSLTFTANLDAEATEQVNISGRFIAGEVAATLTDPAGVFSVSPASLTAEAVNVGEAALTVTFASATEGAFSATLTLTSEGAEPVTIALSATANDGGTASDPYLNIAKYATIDEAGWNTAYVNTLYKYTEYEDEEVAWLTMPMYGAVVGAKYSTTGTTLGSGQPQKWIETSVSQTNQLGSTTWTASDVYFGSSNYFTSTTVKAVGTNSQSSRTNKTVTFYVTNTTAVKLYASQRSTSSGYSTTLNVYECTVNDDGSLTAASAAVESYSHTSSGAASLSITDLDKTKVYKVVASQARGYLYEIAFQTPLKKAVLIGDVNRDGTVTIADVTAIVNIILGKETADDNYDHQAADVNADGSITIADVTALVNQILGK